LQFLELRIYSTCYICITLSMEKTDKEMLEDLWAKIKEARKALKLSQAELAEKIWIDRGYISMVEKWKTNITFLKLKKICEELWMEFKI